MEYFMNRVLFKLLFAFLFVALVLPINAKYKLGDDIPTDPKVKIGKLSNGLTYYIRENKKPEKRAELRIVVNAGAILEDDDQNGLAHFTEHMLFNGTKNFPKDNLISFLQSTGMRFGADVNASTGHDQTFYMLQLPTDKEDVLNKGIQVLVDWAHYASFDDEEIDKERGVIIEEWRQRNGANARVGKVHNDKIFAGSKYVLRDVIGDTNIIRTFKHDVIRRYYKDWYRPDLMAIIAIGDFDANAMEAKLKQSFGEIPANNNPRKREYFNIPPTKGTEVSFSTDKEYPMSVVQIIYKRPEITEGKYGDYRQSIVRGLYDQMFNARLDELSKKSESAYMRAGAQETKYIGPGRAYMIFAISKENKILETIETVNTEAYRVLKHGFTQSELVRVKQEFLKNIEKSFKEKDKTPSAAYTREYMSNYLEKEPIPGIEEEWKIVQEFVPSITLAEINALAKDYVKEDNRIVTISAPDKPAIVLPTKDAVIAKLNEIAKRDIPAYQDKEANKPLFTKQLEPKEIVDTKQLKDIDVTELKLKNGVKVVFKKTNFKNDEIVLVGTSPGGLSLAKDEDFYSASRAADIVNESGLSDFDDVTLGKMLSGKIVRVAPHIADLTEGFRGSTTPEDLETAMQMIYLYFTQPRKDADAFKSYIDNSKNSVKNNALSPEANYRDSVTAIMSQYNFREMPWTEDKFSKVDMNKAFEFYNDRFKDASDFTFFFVGNFDEAKLKNLCQKYLGNLPSINRTENWKDNGVKAPKGMIDKKIRKGVLDKSIVRLIFTGDAKWSTENRFMLNSMIEVLNMRLREVVREEKGGTYGAYSNGTITHYPKEGFRIDIGFGCDPKRVDELVKAALDQVELLKKEPMSQDYITKVIETAKRQNETNMKENNFWLNSLVGKYTNDCDPNEILQTDKLIQKINPESIQKIAQEYFTTKNVARIVLFPEKD